MAKGHVAFRVAGRNLEDHTRTPGPLKMDEANVEPAWHGCFGAHPQDTPSPLRTKWRLSQYQRLVFRCTPARFRQPGLEPKWLRFSVDTYCEWFHKTQFNIKPNALSHQ